MRKLDDLELREYGSTISVSDACPGWNRFARESCKYNDRFVPTVSGTGCFASDSAVIEKGNLSWATVVSVSRSTSTSPSSYQ